MLRHRTLLRCSAAAAQTLTAWLSRLAEQAEALPRASETGGVSSTSATAPADAGASSSFTSSSTAAAQRLLRDIEEAATHANALRETDTLFSILHCVLRKRHFPTDAGAWARLADQLLPFGGIEAGSVLCYPAPSKAAARHGAHLQYLPDEASAWPITSPGSSLHSAPHKSYRLPTTRETLLLTGGVVPLSARVPCGDGRMVALFLDDFIQFVRAGERSGLAPDVANAVQSVSKAVLDAVKANAPTLQWELLLPSLLEYMRLLHELDLQSAASVLQNPKEAEADVEAEGDNSDSETAKPAQRTRFLRRMLDGLAHRALTDGAHGARVAVYYLHDYFAKVVDAFQASDRFAHTSPEDAGRLYWMQQRYFISLTQSCMRAVYLHYTPDAAAQARPVRSSCVPADAILAAPIHSKIAALYDQIDVVFQQNTNAANPLRVPEATVSQLKDIHTLALLRALRIEESAPDAYLRRALEVVDRVPASMAIEGELIAGKVRLLDLDSDAVDEDGRTAIYNDLLTSLRSLVEMRPRFARHGGTGPSSDGDAGERSGGEGTNTNERGEEDADDGGADPVRVDAVTQGILQRAHADVITALCAAHKDEWSNEAYNILVTHKYNGVKITKELILPVLEVFSRRGDCRAFNLVDLCVLYSNESIDMRTIALLFRTCAAAGDHYRAETFLQLLSEIIPGFLVRCPASVKESLQELKLLDPLPRHLFVSAEEDLVQSALGAEARVVRRLPDVA
ncbi:hypothetical protein ABB37_01969 [Leptomonas pyrrhocoris]|uniref:Uncharacterized protein n=1 Tax=Leptomonas pyrrhocoris TaxID=157538 RepID=A0A0N0VGP4_LEPPY|nr:hypothetical protein ABB37_01969 [Leptomonas pyrrhocoris]KPA83721.1 hypothetical protein ABB37_01969 [Leptomonas pyrrhocoris]|eukprot:XP_015662160.1 hypothetical protein ABB37_01969 [Leptomonas pyrrhocoris]